MEFDYVALILLLLYCSLFFFEFKQFLQIFYLKNKKINYRNGIILSLLLSSTFRIAFWIKVLTPTTIDSTWMMIIFYLPVWLNFTGISLLCVFYANTIYEDRYGDWPRYICIILNIIFGMLNLTIGCLVESASTNQNRNIVIYDCYIFYAVFIDAFIALLVGYLGYYFVYDHHYHSYRHWVLLPRSIETFSVINWLIVCCFFIRSIFVFIFSLPIVKQSANTEIHFNGEHSVTSVLMLFFFLITEWIPNSSMLYLLWKPSTSKTKKYRSENYLPTSPSSSSLSSKNYSLMYRLVSVGGEQPSSNSLSKPSSSHSVPSLLSFPGIFSSNNNLNALDSHHRHSHHHLENGGSLFGKHDRNSKNATRISTISEERTSSSNENHNQLTEADFLDQGITVRTSVEDSMIRVYYNDSRDPSLVQDPRDLINREEEDLLEERVSDYGQHTSLLAEDTDFPPATMADDYHPHHPRGRNPSWNKGNAVISSLYLNSSSQQVTRLPHQGEHEINRTDSRNALATKHTSFSSIGNGHLDPSAIYKVVNLEEEAFQQYDLSEKYADTIGPRDILKSKL